MLKYVLKRIGLMVVTLWFIVTVTFFAMISLPGNPYPNGERLDNEQIAILDEQYGFNRPVMVQYADYMLNILGFEGVITTKSEGASDSIIGWNMGYSFTKVGDVSTIILRSYPYSLFLGLMSLVVGTLIGIALGLAASIRKNSFMDYLATFIAVLGVSFPSFVLASYTQYYLASQLGLFPVLFNKGDPMSYVLPVASLAVFAIAQVARVTRTEMVEVLGSNYINLARAKGVKRSTLIGKHAFKNTMISILTILGPLMVSLTTGSLVIETIFGIPGIGNLLTTGVLNSDVFLVLGVTIFLAIQILVMYLIVDVLYGIVDPRIRVGGSNNG